ncbi:hypothetical protein CCH79_00011940 [Gambusia affinis]|uniref:RNA-binding protein 41 n=1 Tax=Gambusia affinis TaxID=33528 RepID=A0A315VMK8_GAMAF|nr:hypothetical protein CCH79_00011940 [Gambusia affinis]
MFGIYRNTDPRLFQCVFSVHVRSSVDGSLSFIAPKTNQKYGRGFLRLSLSLSRLVVAGWALSLCLFLLRLSLLVTPPCVPTPHLSVSQQSCSPAEERSRARPSRTGRTRARCTILFKCEEGRGIMHAMCSSCSALIACSAHVNLLTSCRELIEAARGCGGVSRRACEEGPLLEEQETEGQRQLHSLLLQQLHTGVDVDRCVAKRQCFAPASLYRPFGEQAAGVRSLSQFQALQDGEKEVVGLQELGLTEAEIQLWQNREAPDMSGDKSNGVCAAPDARRQRLQAIRDKIEARAELLSRPQRFSASRPLSRREMEIEQALFQGNDRLGFLTALYHRDGNTEESLQGASSSDPLDSLYRDVLRCQKHLSPEDSEGQQAVGSTSGGTSDQSQSSQSHSPHHGSDLQSEDTSEHQQDRADAKPQAPPERIDLNQPIGRLGGASGAKSGKPLTVSGEIKTLPDEEILNNRESVLCVKNLSAQASIAQLVALFSRFEQKDGPPVVYRVLTGRMKGQAFITLPDTETAQNALWLVHGYRLLGKPLVVEFGRERQEEEKQIVQEGEKEMKIKEQRNSRNPSDFIHQTGPKLVTYNLLL